MGRKNKAAFRKTLHRKRSRQLKSKLNKVEFTGITKTRKSTRSAEDVIKYMEMNVIPEKKNRRIYNEIRYTRLNSLSLSEPHQFFDSKGNIKV